MTIFNQCSYKVFVIGEITTADVDSTVADHAAMWWLKCFNIKTFFSQRFAADTHLSCGMVCSDVFPSPVAIQRAMQKIPVPLQLELEAHRCNLIPHHSNMCSRVLHKSAFIGVGGNGVVLKQALKGRKYAVKWVSYRCIFLVNR